MPLHRLNRTKRRDVIPYEEKLHSEVFSDKSNLLHFVNSKLSRQRVQSIIKDSETNQYILFYWD